MSVNTPFQESAISRSAPPAPVTLIEVNRLRSKAKSAVPSAPGSTSRVDGSPTRSRSEMASGPVDPATLSTPFLTEAFTAVDAADAPYGVRERERSGDEGDCRD